MAPSSVLSRTGSAISKTARKVKNTVSKIAHSISSGSRKSKSSNSNDGESQKAGESDTEKAPKWTSPVYTFFDSNVETLTDSRDGRKYQAFKCTAPGGCRSKSDFRGVKRYQTKANGDPHSDRSSTSNLKKHARQCWGIDVVDARIQGITSDAKREPDIFASFARAGQRPVNVTHRTHTKPEFRARIVRWISEANRPLKILEDRQLKDLLTAGRPELKVPSRSTAARDLKAVHERSAEWIKKLLKDHDGRISFATDAWTSPNHRAFVAWTVHLQHKGEPLVFLLDIFEVPESHTGEVLAREFDDMLRRFGLERKILAWTGDNATSNDTQNTVLAASTENDFEAVNRVRCFNHTMNLAVKSFMRPFQPRPKRKDASGNIIEPGDDDGDLSEPIIALDDDDDSLPDLEELSDTESVMSDDTGEDAFDELSAPKRAEMLRDTKKTKTALSSIRKLAFALINSPTIGLPGWRRACAKHKLRVRYIPRDVPTRWNSTYDMLVFAVRYKAAVNDITGDRELNYRAFFVSNDDWVIIEDMVHVLEVFKRATLLFSAEDKSTIANVVTTMDKIDDLLTTTIVSSVPGRRVLQNSVRQALHLAKATLNKYYSHTDASNIYRIAMVLHPSLKLQYFRSRRWEQDWIDTAEQLVKDEFEMFYNSVDDEIEILEGGDGDAVSVSSSAVELDLAADWFLDFDLPSTSTRAGTISELERYLSEPVVTGVKDPLKWWYEKRDVYPKLSRMALDYHSIPSTSTSVERVFSQGRHILSFTRNRLTGASVRRFLCLGSWSRKDLVRDQDAVKAVKQVMKGTLSAKEKGAEDENAGKRKRGEDTEGRDESGTGKKARTSKG